MSSALRMGIAGALVAVSVAVPCVLRHQTQLELRARQDAVEQQAARLSRLAEENGRLSNLVARPKPSALLTGEQLRELLRLRNERHWLAEQTNLLTRLVTGTSASARLSPSEPETALSADMTAAMKRILPGLQPALQQYALAHSNQLPRSFAELQDYFPLAAGRKMAGLQTFEFVREGGPKPGDALLLRGNAGQRPADGSQVRVYGLSDGRVLQVSSEDGRFDEWEAQHLTFAPSEIADIVNLEANGTAGDRARLVEAAASMGIPADDANRFFDGVKQQQQVLGQKLAEMEKSLNGSPEDKQKQMRAAIEQQLNQLALDTLGDKGPALVQKMVESK